MSQQTLQAGLAAVYRCELPNDSLYLSCRRIWTWLTNEWLPSSHYQPDDRPPYEIYLKGPKGHPCGHLLMEFCMPVRPLHETICTVD
jgi:DNA gyrase inhibitor GyrI